MLNKKEAIEYIETNKWKGISRIDELMACFDNVQDKLKIVHVAGSNGKGSFCAMISSVLKQAGYKVGTFISPHLIEYNERFLINGKCISDDDFIRLTDKVKQACDSLSYRPKFFEVLTCVAFLYFYEQNCDIVVLEVGLGGRLDATNVIKNSVLSIIMNIGLEHTAILGDTLEKIAYEKAGIIKENGDVLVYDLRKVLPVYEKVCDERNARLYKSDFSLIKRSDDFDYKEYKSVKLSLLGEHQINNACVVLDCIDILNSKGFNISKSSVLEGLKNTNWDARMSVLSKSPLFIVDGAHNVQCIQALVTYLATLNKKITFILGVLDDKNYKEMIDLLLPYGNKFICVKPDNKRALDNKIICDYINSNGKNAVCIDDVYSAIKLALNDECVVSCGSLYLSGEIYINYKKYIRRKYKEKVNSLSKQEVKQLSSKICERIKNSCEFKRAKNIMIYKAKGNEVDLSELEKEDKVFSYPVCLDTYKMKAVVPFDNKFYKNQYDILEPVGEEMKDIDLIICPLICFDEELNRIGYGKGYYDRFLSNKTCLKVGVAYDFCKTYKISGGCFDLNLDIVYSEVGIYKRV